MFFQVVSPFVDVAIIARGNGLRTRKELERRHGKGAWRKLKGVATVQLADGRRRLAEVHWYEAHGIGKRDFKIKRFLHD